MLKDSRGFSLLEMIIAIALITAVGSFGLVSYANITVTKNHKKSEEIILKTKEAYQSYYDNKGQEPVDLVTLAPYMQSVAPVLDGFRRPLTLWKDITYDPTGSAAVSYDAAILSGGRDGVVDSTKDASGLVTLSPTDIITFVSLEMPTENKVEVAAKEIDAITSAALYYYSKTGSTPTSMGQIAGHTGLTRLDGSGRPLDPWKNPYVGTFGSLAQGGFFSVASYGRDGADGGGDDLGGYVTEEQFLGCAREDTVSRIVSANMAKTVFEANWGSTNCDTSPGSCVLNLVTDPNGQPLLCGCNAYDAWGTVFHYDTAAGGFVSAGADRDFSTTSDNVY